MRPISRALSFLFLLCFASGLSAQYSQQQSPTVEAVEISYGGLHNVSREVIMAHIQIRVGMKYDQLLVDRSVRSLYDTGLFDFVQATLSDGGTPDQVKVVFNVESKYRVQSIDIVGNQHLSRKKALSMLKVRPGQSLDERVVAAGVSEIRDHYLDKGFTNATVDYSIDRNQATGLGTVVVTVDEGMRLKISKVRFEGNERFSDRTLRGQMQTSRYKWYLSWLTGSGRLDEDKLDDDVQRIRDFYRNKGYLDVEIADDDVKVLQDGHNITLDITVHEGRQYYVGEISVEGEEIIDELVITRSLKMIPGDPFSPEQLDKDIETISDLYGSQGRLEAQVRAERIPNIETGNIDIKYVINEGEPYRIESVNIEGNTKTKSVVILREVMLRPGQIFNTVWMKASEARLKNTRFFSDVNVQPESTNVPGRKNLKVTVSEAPTGQFQVGVGFSSLENAVVFFEYSQGNFDLFNWRSFFQGDGQKFRFRASVGSSSNEVVLSFEEPYFMEQRLGVGFELYRRESDYNSSYYDEIRAGLQVYARKLLFELVEGRLTYTIENVTIDMNYSDTAHPVIQAEDGTRLVSKVGLLLLRDTRNDLLFTTRGSRISLEGEVAGLGGDTKYASLESRNAFYLPTFETGDQVVALLLRGGTIIPFEKSLLVDGVGNPIRLDNGDTFEYGVPFFDRFFLGGPYSLRGFEYREVGPRNNGEPIGGNSYGFASLEYTVKLADQFRIAMFYDWGFVNSDEFDFSPLDYNDDWGFGIRLLVMNNPLSLDYALPITDDGTNDEGGQFNFSFGTRF